MTRPGHVTRRAPNIPRLLSEGDVQLMHGAALKLLDEVGLHVEDQSLIAQLAAHRGVRARGSRILLRPGLVEERISPLREARQGTPAPGLEKRIRLSAGCCASHIVDSDTLEVRPVTTEDLIGAAKLIDAIVKAGLTQGDVADRIGCSVPFVNKLVHCHTLPSRRLAARLQSELKIDSGLWDKSP